MKHLESTDQQLIELLNVGNREAFQVIYERYWAGLLQWGFKVLQDRSAAEDAIQEVFVELWLKRGSLFIQNLQAYLYQSTRFQLFKIIRHNKVIAAHIERSFLLNYSFNDADHNLAIRDIRKILEETVAHLPVQCRTIFNLSRNEHLTTKEIAMQMGLSPKTVDNQLNIALKRIRSAMSVWVVLAELLITHYH